MKPSTWISVLIAVLGTWTIASAVFYMTYTKEYLYIHEYALSPDEIAEIQYARDQGSYDEVGSGTVTQTRGIQIGVDCLGAGMSLGKGCRMYGDAQKCAQLACEANKCSSPDSCEASDFYNHSNCEVWETTCKIDAPRPGNPNPPPPPIEPGAKVSCEWWDVVCKAVHDSAPWF